MTARYRGFMPNLAATTEFDPVAIDLVGALKSFASTLTQSQVKGNAVELLPKAIQYADRLGLKRVAIADRCQVSQATLSRWANQVVKPHTLVAKAALEIMSELAIERALEFQKGLREFGP